MDFLIRRLNKIGKIYFRHLSGWLKFAAVGAIVQAAFSFLTLLLVILGFFFMIVG